MKINYQFLKQFCCVFLITVSVVYRAGLWNTEQPEPTLWDIELVKNRSEIQSGCALAIAHHTEVTFGKIEVNPIVTVSTKTIDGK